MSREAPTRRCWPRIVCRVSRTNSHIASRYFFAAEGLSRPRPSSREAYPGPYCAAIEAWSRPGSEERRPGPAFGRAGSSDPRPWSAGHGRGAANRVTFGGGWNDDEGLLAPVGARGPCRSGLEDVGGVEPALVDGVLDLAGAGYAFASSVSPAARPRSAAAAAIAAAPRLPPGFRVFAPSAIARSVNQATRSSSGRTVVRGTTPPPLRVVSLQPGRRSSRPPVCPPSGPPPRAFLSGASRTKLASYVRARFRTAGLSASRLSGAGPRSLIAGWRR